MAITDVTTAVWAAADLVALAQSDSSEAVAEQAEAQRKEIARQLGFGETDRLPASLRTQFREADEHLRRRQTRAARDGVDRILLDLMTLMRDVSVIRLGVRTPLINVGLEAEIADYASFVPAASAVRCLAAIDEARARIAGNVQQLVALEAMLVEFAIRRSRTPAALPVLAGAADRAS